MSINFYSSLRTSDGALIQMFYRLSRIYGGSFRKRLNDICIPCNFTAIQSNKNALARFMDLYNSEMKKHEYNGNPT